MTPNFYIYMLDIYERIDFAFQDACFEFVQFPVTIPYPVPFKLLGDEAKGYVSEGVDCMIVTCITRGIYSLRV